jgi:hypothetical protein
MTTGTLQNADDNRQQALYKTLMTTGTLQNADDNRHFAKRR